jgi:hypothetical protein
MSKPINIYKWIWNVTCCGMDPQNNQAWLGEFRTYFPGHMSLCKSIMVSAMWGSHGSTNKVKIMCWPVSDLSVVHSKGMRSSPFSMQCEVNGGLNVILLLFFKLYSDSNLVSGELLCLSASLISGPTSSPNDYPLLVTFSNHPNWLSEINAAWSRLVLLHDPS